MSTPRPSDEPAPAVTHHPARLPTSARPAARGVRLGSGIPDPQTSLERMTLALLPLRIFLGVTFVYAGVDKLIDPAFLQASGPGSIGAQLEAFIRVSPIAPLDPGRRADLPRPDRIPDRRRRDRDRARRAERPAVPAIGRRRLRAVDPVLADRLVGDQALLLRAGPAVCVRLADARARRNRRPVHHRVMARSPSHRRSVRRGRRRRSVASSSGPGSWGWRRSPWRRSPGRSAQPSSAVEVTRRRRTRRGRRRRRRRATSRRIGHRTDDRPDRRPRRRAGAPRRRHHRRASSSPG